MITITTLVCDICSYVLVVEVGLANDSERQIAIDRSFYFYGVSSSILLLLIAITLIISNTLLIQYLKKSKI